MRRTSNKHYYYKDLEWWAENGLIYMEDHRDNSFQAIPVRKILERANALVEERNRITARARVSAHSSGNLIAAEDVELLQTGIEGLVAAAREARGQGDPGDPKVIMHMRNQRRKHMLMPVSTIRKLVDTYVGELSGAGIMHVDKQDPDTDRSVQIILG